MKRTMHMKTTGQMNASEPKKLACSRQTIRVLLADDLPRVAGGQPTLVPTDKA
jgi:hypothetical protein